MLDLIYSFCSLPTHLATLPWLVPFPPAPRAAAAMGPLLGITPGFTLQWPPWPVGQRPAPSMWRHRLPVTWLRTPSPLPHLLSPF